MPRTFRTFARERRMPFDESAEDEIRRFEEQFRSQPESLVFARLADALRKSGDSLRALEVLEEGIRRHPDYLSAHIVRAKTLRELGRAAEARSAFERVLEIDAQNLVAIRGLAEIARESGDSAGESTWLERLELADPQGPGSGEVEPVASPPPDRADEGPGEGVPPGLPEMVSELWSGPAIDPVRGRVADSFAADLNAVILDDQATARSESGTGERPENAWWFEPPVSPTDDEAGRSDPEAGEVDDADLLTRTMAELYARQGLTDEAEAIYRELLIDRPDDEALRAGLEAVLGMRAARGAKPSSGGEQQAATGPEPGTDPDSAAEAEAVADDDAVAADESAADSESVPAQVERGVIPDARRAGSTVEERMTAGERLRRLLREGEELADRFPEPREDKSVLETWLEGLRG